MIPRRFASLINPSPKQVTFGWLRLSQTASSRIGRAYAALSHSGKGGLALPRGAECHLFGARVNKFTLKIL